MISTRRLVLLTFFTLLALPNTLLEAYSAPMQVKPSKMFKKPALSQKTVVIPPALQIIESAFCYLPNLDPEYRVGVTQFANRNAGRITRTEQAEIYRKLAEDSEQDPVDFKNWVSSAAPNPPQFYVRLRVKNTKLIESEPTKVIWRVEAKVGEYYVDQDSYMVDNDYLFQTAKWKSLPAVSETVPALSSGETLDVYSSPIYFLKFLAGLKNQFPVQLRATPVIAGKAGKPVLMEIQSGAFASDSLNR